MCVSFSNGAFRCLRCNFRSAVEFRRYLPQSLEIRASYAFGAAAADEFHTPILSDFRAAAHQEQPDLPGAVYVGSAAGLKIGAFDLYSPQNSRAVDFLAHASLCQLFRRAVSHCHAAIFKDDFVCGTLCAFADFFGRFRAAEVNGRDLRAQMKRDGGQSEALLKNRREEMLSGVLLHVVEAAIPVDATLYVSEFERAVDDMDDLIIFIPDVEDTCAGNLPRGI